MNDLVLNVNGSTYEVRAKVTATLADVVREQIGLTGTKIFCNEGECGSCTVLMDGMPVLSCLTLALQAEGREIQTIEGVADPATGDLHPIQQAFVDHSGLQCAVCVPGIILTGKALLDENPNPTEREIKEALAGNLCRCGNYQRMTECLLVAADVMRSDGGHD